MGTLTDRRLQSDESLSIGNISFGILRNRLSHRSWHFHWGKKPPWYPWLYRCCLLIDGIWLFIQAQEHALTPFPLPSHKQAIHIEQQRRQAFRLF